MQQREGLTDDWKKERLHKGRREEGGGARTRSREAWREDGEVMETSETKAG